MFSRPYPRRLRPTEPLPFVDEPPLFQGDNDPIFHVETHTYFDPRRVQRPVP